MIQEKPELTVSRIIKDKLAEKKIMTTNHLADIDTKLAAGTITEQDWLLMADLSLENEGESNAKTN